MIKNSIITYEYSGITDSGKPRFARYIRLRDDITIQEHKNVTNCKDVIIHQFQTLDSRLPSKRQTYLHQLNLSHLLFFLWPEMIFFVHH